MDSGTKRKRQSLTGVGNARLRCNEDDFNSNQSGYQCEKPHQEVKPKRKYVRKAHLVKHKQKPSNDEEVTAPFPYPGGSPNYPNNFCPPVSERKPQDNIPDPRYANDEARSGSNSSSPSYTMLGMPAYTTMNHRPAYNFAEDQYAQKDPRVPDIQPPRSHYNGVTLLLYQITEISLVHINLYRRDLERSKVIFYKMHNYFMNNYPVLLRNSYEWRNLQPFERIKQCTNLLANHLAAIESLDTVTELKLQERLHVKFTFYSQNQRFDKAWCQLAIIFEDTVTVVTRFRERIPEDPSKNQDMSYHFTMTENGPGFKIEELSVNEFYSKYCNNRNYYPTPPEGHNIHPANLHFDNRAPNRREIIRPWIAHQESYRANPCDCREPIPYKEFRSKLDLEKRYIYRSNANGSPGIIRPWDNPCDITPNASSITENKNLETPGHQAVQESNDNQFLRPNQPITTHEELHILPSEIPQVSEVSVIFNPETGETIHNKDSTQANSEEKTNTAKCSINHSKIISKIISEVSNIGNKNFTTIEEVISEILLTIIECVSFHGEDSTEDNESEKLDDNKIRNNPEMIKVCDQIIKVMTNKAEKKAVRISEVRNILKNVLNGHLRRSEVLGETVVHKEIHGPVVEGSTGSNVEIRSSNSTGDSRQTKTETVKDIIYTPSSGSTAPNVDKAHTVTTHIYPKAATIPNISTVTESKGNLFPKPLKPDNKNTASLPLQENIKTQPALIYRTILEDCKKKYKENLTKEIEKLIPTDIMVYDSKRNVLLRFPNPTDYQQWLVDRENNKNTIIRLYVEPFAFATGDCLTAVQYVREVQMVCQYVPADFAKFYDYLTKSKIVNKYNPITFCKFLSLYNDNCLQNDFKNYIEYLRKSMKSTVGKNIDEPVLTKL